MRATKWEAQGLALAFAALVAGCGGAQEAPETKKP